MRCALRASLKANFVSGPEFFEKAGLPLECSQSAGLGRRLGIVRRSEPDARGSHHAAIDVALRPALDYRRTRLDGPGTQLGAGHIHQDSAVAAGLFPRFLKIADHAQPHFRAVVRAVDAHAVHPIPDQVAHQVHSLCAASEDIVTMMRTFLPGGGGPRRASVLASSNSDAFADLYRGLLGAWQGAVGTQQGIQHAMHGLDRVEDVTFRAPERGEPKQGKLGLQFANIVPAQRKIVGKISRAAPVRFMMQRQGVSAANLPTRACPSKARPARRKAFSAEVYPRCA